MTTTQIFRLLKRVVRKDNKALTKACAIVANWHFEALEIILEHYKLPKRPYKWADLPAWEKEVLPKLKTILKGGSSF